MSAPEERDELTVTSAQSQGPGGAKGSPFSLLDAAELARKILASDRIKLASMHHSGIVDEATPVKQLAAAAQGQPAARSSKGGAPGGTVVLDAGMLAGMLQLAESYTFEVSEIAGGVHPATDTHYAGLAFDICRINGAAVNASHPYWRRLLRRGRALGATEAFGPGMPGASHVHLGWPASGPLAAGHREFARELVGCGVVSRDAAPVPSGSVEQHLRETLAALEGERARLSRAERACLPGAAERSAALSQAIHHVRDALRALGANF